MYIYLPIAEMSVPAEAILALGVFVGFLSGVFGVGGGFLSTPFMIFLGIPPAVAVGTQASQLVASGVSGVLGHLKKGNVDIKIGIVMLGGGFIGSIIGIFIFKMLKHFGQIDLVISALYVILLGVIGGMMLFESILSFFKKGGSDKKTGDFLSGKFASKLPYKMKFEQSKIYVSALIPAFIGFVGGLLVSIMGIGGGFLLVPAMIYILGMSPLLVAGTSLFQIIFTTAFSTVLHAVANHTVDLVLSVLLIVGGVIGVRVGLAMAKYFGGVGARIFLSLMIVIIAIKMAFGLLVEPEDYFSVVVR